MGGLAVRQQAEVLHQPCPALAGHFFARLARRAGLEVDVPCSPGRGKRWPGEGIREPMPCRRSMRVVPPGRRSRFACGLPAPGR